MKIHTILFAVVVLLAGCGSPETSHDNTTPPHVYQASEHIILKMQGFARAMGRMDSPSRQTFEGKQPRHVLQKAREILMRIDRYKRDKDLTPAKYPVFPVRHVHPADVLLLVKTIDTEITGLESHFSKKGGLPSIAMPTLRPGLTPSDVYSNMTLIGRYLNVLGAAALDPSDVLQMAKSLTEDFHAICLVQDIRCPQQLPAFVGGKIPAEVYKRASAIYTIVHKIAHKLPANEDADMKITGSIQVPPKKRGNIVPADVLEILNQLIADVGAVKNTLGVEAPMMVHDWKKAKPSHVFQQLGVSLRAAKLIEKSL